FQLAKPAKAGSRGPRRRTRRRVQADRRGERSPDAQLPAGESRRSAAGRRLEFASRDQLAGNDIALYLVGPFADDHEGGVAEVALDIVFGGIAVAAVDSDGVERD